ncbi:helix-turn-helix domain-containing protein [Streptomyces sp. NBC_00425]|uniref:helix-turn-helix domain-containing protein n=1 Tax=Streptomyces sp. NBC_00425 TaxID=2975740 RepID=UPI002E245203
MVPQIADEVRCSQKTVRRWLHRFNRSGLEGLEDLGGQGRKRRITEAERSRIIAMVKQTPPGRLEVQPSNEMWAADESGPSEWTLDTLAAAAQDLGIEVSRSQVRRILLAEGGRGGGAPSGRAGTHRLGMRGREAEYTCGGGVQGNDLGSDTSSRICLAVWAPARSGRR